MRLCNEAVFEGGCVQPRSLGDILIPIHMTRFRVKRFQWHPTIKVSVFGDWSLSTHPNTLHHACLHFYHLLLSYSCPRRWEPSLSTRVVRLVLEAAMPLTFGSVHMGKVLQPRIRRSFRGFVSPQYGPRSSVLLVTAFTIFKLVPPYRLCLDRGIQRNMEVEDEPNDM